MAPAVAFCPSESFTPRNFGCESRKFLAVPPAFLCAIKFYLVLIANLYRWGMWARIAADVGSRIARSVQQGKTRYRAFSLLLERLVADENLKKDAWTVLVVLGVGLGSWCLGRLSSTGSDPVAVAGVEIKNVFADAQDRFVCKPQEPQERGEGSAGRPAPAPGSVVGSKNGSKYHLPRCSGANAIKEENKIWFASEAAAEAAGYTRAGNCK